MILRSRVRDCLFINWALPRASLPAPPEELRYEVHEHEGAEWIFASALLFRQRGLYVSSLPWARFSYPQLNLRSYVVDREGVPAVLFHAMWTPRWIVPAARWIGGQPVRAARMSYPGGLSSLDEPARWRVADGGWLTLSATAGAAVPGPGPRLGSWEQTVNYIRRRPRGYIPGEGGLQRVETSHTSSAIWPAAIELGRTDLLESSIAPADGWPPIHSSWICPELSFEFEVLPESEAALARQLPAPG